MIIIEELLYVLVHVWFINYAKKDNHDRIIIHIVEKPVILFYICNTCT